MLKNKDADDGIAETNAAPHVGTDPHPLDVLMSSFSLTAVFTHQDPPSPNQMSLFIGKATPNLLDDKNIHKSMKTRAWMKEQNRKLICSIQKC